MSRPILLVLVFWNIVLTLLVGYGLYQGRTPAQIDDGRPDIAVADDVQSEEKPPLPVDTAALAEARIAFFFMDTIQDRYTLVKESADRVRAEGRKLEQELGRELQKAQARAQELASKDHTYSTQAQLQADQKEFQELELRIQELRMSSQDKIDALQMRMLGEIAQEVEDFLEEYNSTAGFDYIFSVQDGGQIWVGNKRLDITQDVLNGLNERHRARKARK